MALWHYFAVFARRDRPGSVDAELSWPARLALLSRMWRIAAETQLALWRLPLPQVVLALDTSGTEPRASLMLLNRALSRGLRVGPWRPRCLLRSLVLFRMLRAQGDPAELVIGLPHHPKSRDAHAWVEMAGRDVGPAPGRSGYQELTRYPRDRRQPSTPAR
jgi:hypothetical protein